MSSGVKPPSVSAARTCRENSSQQPSAIMVPMTRMRGAKHGSTQNSACKTMKKQH